MFRIFINIIIINKGNTGAKEQTRVFRFVLFFGEFFWELGLKWNKEIAMSVFVCLNTLTKNYIIFTLMCIYLVYLN